jgi:2-C-methyl-D-erythritol 4-phosphate cytidylyltransferase
MGRRVMVPRFEDFAVLITAAGNSSRMGSGKKKEFTRMGERTVLTETLSRFFSAGRFACFVVTMNTDSLQETRRIVSEYAAGESDSHRIEIVPGGSSRQESVFLGLRALTQLSPEYVLIHDGARPWVSTDTIRRVAEGTRAHGACIPVLPVVDALKTIDADGFVTGHPERNGFAGAQTPQGFDFRRILTAHTRAAAGRPGSCSDGYVDDSHVFCEYGGSVFTVSGDAENRKITYPGDLPSDII